MSNRTLLKSSLILGGAAIFSKFIGFFLRFPLMRMIGAEGFGLFSYPSYIYAILLSIAINGIPTVIAKLVSERVAVDKRREAHKLFIVSLKLLLSLGILTSFLLYFAGGKLVGTIWPEETYYSLIGLVLAPVFVSVLAVFRGYFQGMQIMMATSISQVVESLGRLIFGLGLAYLLVGYGIEYAAGGAAFGSTGGAFIGMISIIVFYLFRRGKIKDAIRDEKEYEMDSSMELAKGVLKLSIPISIGAIAGTLMPLIDSLMVPVRLATIGYLTSESTALYGNLTGCITLINLPLGICVAISSSLVPAIAHAKVCQSIGQVQSRVNQGLRLGVFIAMPAAVGLFVLAQTILHLIFPSMHHGVLILKLLSIAMVFMAINQIFTATIQALGHYMRPVKNLFIGTALKLMIGYVLLAIPSINILGAVIGSIVAYLVSSLLNYRFIIKEINIGIAIKNTIIKPLLASIIMGVMVYIANIILPHTIKGLMLSVIIGMVTYGLAIIAVGGITIDEIKRILNLN